MTHRATIPRIRGADRGLNLHETDPVAVDALYYVERLPKTIWEPACGRGAISEVLREKGHSVFSTDVVDRGYVHQNGVFDFLKEEQAPAKPEAIVTNPPFDWMAQFVAAALDRAPLVCMLLPLTFLEAGVKDDAAGRARRLVMDERRPARIHVFRNRLPAMHRDGWKGRRVKTATRAFAWYVWERGHEGATEIRRITWEPR